jgi:hypothetical protein
VIRGQDFIERLHTASRGIGFGLRNKMGVLGIFEAQTSEAS